jgi:hypothetical protein
MQRQKVKAEVLTIPPLGECTLLPLNDFPETLCTYENILITAKELELNELPSLSHSEIQDIFKAVAQKLAPIHVGIHIGMSIWISGSHLSYPVIDSGDMNQCKEKCISSLELFYLDGSTPIEMTVTEIPTTETREI